MATPIPANRAALDASMIHGRVVRSSGRKAIGISTDSRAIVPGNAFGESGDGFVRASFAASDELLQKTIDRLADWLGKK